MQLSACIIVFLAVGLAHGLSPYTVCPTYLQVANSSCLTLSQYVEDSSLYFVDNSSFAFLPGEHSLNVSVTLDSVANIFFIGGPEVTITCNGPVNIKCRNVTNVIFSHLNFVSCGGGELLSSNSAALVFVDSDPVQVTYASFRGHNRLFSRSIHSTYSTLYISHFNATRFNGGAMHVIGGVLQISGNNNFTSNIGENGSAIFAQDSLLNFTGQTVFLSNKARQRDGHTLCGGAVYSMNTTLLFAGNTSFIQNGLLAPGFGGAVCLVDNSLVLSGRTRFVANGAASGGAIAVFNGVVQMNGDCEFSYHNVSGNGGAVYMINANLQGPGQVTFHHNTAANGGSVHSESTVLIFYGDVVFYNNSATIAGGAVFASNSLFKLEKTSQLRSNHAGAQGGAVYALNSTIRFSGVHELSLNYAPLGGALSLITCTLIFRSPLRLLAANNEADFGGVIYVSEAFSLLQCARSFNLDISNHPQCFLGVEGDGNVSFVVDSNRASVSGSVLYGGNLHICRFRVGNQPFRINALEYLSGILTSPEPNSDKASLLRMITSDPTQMCFCDQSGIINCGVNRTIATQRGKLVTLSIVAVGQALSPVPSIIRSYFETTANSKSFAELGVQERVQLTTPSCNDLNYRVFSPNSTEALVLYPDGPCRDTGNATISVYLQLAPCPDGFQLEGGECRCQKTLQQFTNMCNIDDGTISRSGGYWFAGLYMCNDSILFERVIIEPDNSDANCTLQYAGLLTHRRCPFDFCVTDDVNVSLSNPDVQCSQNRTGVLCGACENGTSLLIGGFRCAQCTDSYLGLLVLFAVAGLGLVFLLFILKLTVAMGTINGLIFYANIVSANRITFLPNNPTNPLTVFIAWINLDFGIETCFYDGMDVYARTWLQFVFPLYLWFIVFSIVFIIRLSEKAAKLFGSNPVPVLATIFLLSYSKILRTVIIALSLTTVYYNDDVMRTVWLYDGNRAYFQFGHAPLGVVALLVLLLLFLPYTLFLLLLPWMQGFSDRKGLRWLNKFKPMADAYFAPYKKQTRYWTGCLLILRCVLFLVFALNFLGDPSINLITISAVVALLLMLPWLNGSLYEKRYLNILEASYYLNLVIFCLGTYHVTAIRGNQAALAYTSIFFAFVTFIGTIVFHAYLQLKLVRCNCNIIKNRSDRFGIMNRGHENTDTTLASMSVTTTDVIIADRGEGYSYVSSTIPFRESLFEEDFAN